MPLKLPIRSGDVRVQPVGHCQVEEARDLVQLLDLVGKTSLTMAGSLEGEEHVELFGAPPGISRIFWVKLGTIYTTPSSRYVLPVKVELVEDDGVEHVHCGQKSPVRCQLAVT